ncbi:arginine--tRNA ligase, partial [Candidatus Parcubacteria bacterium]|nr:arginine--tRNA ligase [Candidatus Parcubacteria bacterium]
IKAITKIFNFKGELVILISQIVTLKGGEKLSKRKGQIVLLEDLIDEVGLDCARFFYLTKSLDTPMEFDFELAKEKSQKNPVFYIQYAFARICSLQNKLKLGDDFEVSLRDLRWLSHPKEITLMKKLLLLPEVIEDCLKDYQIQRIPNYAENLASAFHSFYDECRILGEKKEIQKARIALVLATKIVLKKTLDLMGISAPKKM